MDQGKDYEEEERNKFLGNEDEGCDETEEDKDVEAGDREERFIIKSI